MSQNGSPPEVTAPVFQIENVLYNANTWLQRTEDGGMLIKFAYVEMTPAGVDVTLPAIVVRFDADGWERFQGYVAAGRIETKPQIETAVELPLDLRLRKEP